MRLALRWLRGSLSIFFYGARGDDKLTCLFPSWAGSQEFYSEMKYEDIWLIGAKMESVEVDIR
jgi:hypothetical protein